MKSVLQAGWLLTVAVGNIIVLIIAEAAQLPEKVILAKFGFITTGQIDSINLRSAKCNL